jgi:hypothetical protein
VTLYEGATKGVKLPFIATHEIKLDQAVKFQTFLLLLLRHIFCSRCYVSKDAPKQREGKPRGSSSQHHMLKGKRSRPRMNFRDLHEDLELLKTKGE